MGRRILAFLALALALLAAPHPACAERRVALLIGNGAYVKAGRLDNPTRDAAAMEALLRKAGFDLVELKRDLGRDAMRRALRDFSEAVRDADIALVFYAGHGIEVKGENYLIPTDAVLERDIDVEDETVPLERVFQVLEPARRLRLVILDACRDNPFASTMKRAMAGRYIGRGLARVELPTTDTLLAYAARAGSVALDGEGGNSPYTSALLKHLTTPGLDVTLALRRVRDEVLKSTDGRQEPFFYGSLGGAEIPLVGAASMAVVPLPPPSPAADTVRVCREVEGMSSAAMLRVLADQYRATPVAACIAARLAELRQAEDAKSAAAAKARADADAVAQGAADRICANVQAVANVSVLKAMATQHAGTPAAACIAARIAALAGASSDGFTQSAVPAGDIRRQVIRFISERYFRDVAGAPGAAEIGQMLAPGVDYYGKQRTRDEVVADKLQYYAKWPDRTYALMPETLAINTAPGQQGRWNVEFQYTFRVSGDKAAISGRGIARLGLVAAPGGGFLIASESGEIVERR